MCIAVVDSGASLKAFARMDDAWVGSIDIAIKKAKTACFFGMPTGQIGILSSRPSCSLASLSPVLKHVARLVWKLERHYLQPVHAMFRLPIPHYRVVGEFQFGIAHLLLPAIAAVSTTLYEQSGSNGERFRQLLLNYYFFILEPANAVPSIDAARTLWSVFRNSLAHDLGSMLRDTRRRPKPSSCEFSQGSGWFPADTSCAMI
jgi:hypothetical protein